VVSAASTSPRPDVLIIGGGIAGLAAAIRLAEGGASVKILETRKKLGGRATSFTDARTGQVLDNCQHIVLGCCTNYLDLLARLNAAEKIRWTREQYWVEEGGRVSELRPGWLPAPAHFTTSILSARFMSAPEKLMVARACSKILRTDRLAWQDRTFDEYLASCGQSERLIRRFWEPVIVSACNLSTSRVAASTALHVFQEGFLAASSSADVGVPSVPLVELYTEAERVLSANGGSIELGAGVERVDAASATTTDGRRFEAGKIILAVPVERVNRIVADELRAGGGGGDARFAVLDRFTHSPILGVHMTFDLPILANMPHAVLVDRPTQWLFRKDEAGCALHAVISAADDWLALTEQQIGERVLTDIRACFPHAAKASLLTIRAVKEKLATFAPTPGLDALRPQPTGSSGLVLAGDYTDTGWPATMEGATRSGYAAAAAVLGKPIADLFRPPLKVARLASLLGLRAAAL